MTSDEIVTTSHGKTLNKVDLPGRNQAIGEASSALQLNQLQNGLRQAFVVEQHRIVFWYDPELSFESELARLNLEAFGVEPISIINMATESALAIKLKLELHDNNGRYLLYFPFSEPDVEKDWLLDIKLYSRCFYADRFSIIFNELGLQQQSLREHLVQRESFLSSSIRVKSLSRYISHQCKYPQFNEHDIDCAMIAAVVNAESATLVDILLAMAKDLVDENCGLEVNPTCLTDIERFNLLPGFIDLLALETGFQLNIISRTNTVGHSCSNADVLADSQPGFQLGHFFTRLLVTGFCESIGDRPSWANGLVISTAGAQATARSLLSRWRDSSRFYPIFDEISEWVAHTLAIENKLAVCDLFDLQDAVTFEVIEQKIITELVQTIPLNIPKASSAELNRYHQLVTARMDGYWASKHKDDDKRRRYRAAYTALQAAISLFTLRQQYIDGFHFESTEAFYSAYESELYQFDTAYRHYCLASQRSGLNILKSLDDSVESCYSHWTLDQMAKGWGDLINTEQFIERWQLSGVPNQYNFYQDRVVPLFQSGAKRVAVIISDAFRYEAAVELCERINEKRYSEASLSSQLGVVPSYTTLGMASLLPHQSLEYRAVNDARPYSSDESNHQQNGTASGLSDDVLVDGLSTQGIDARAKILAQYQGIALTADQLRSWTQAEGREAVKDHQLVYIYHNMVDARGDNSATESETFAAVDAAIDEIAELSRKIFKLNISNVLITADHGFLFQQQKLENADRTALVDKPRQIIKNKKRYVIGLELPESNDVIKGSTQQTAGTLSGMDFWVPQGINRFHFVGGSRFVHGGIMPQEIVVPVVNVKQLRGDKAQQRTKRKVNIISAKSSLKMVTTIQKFELRQTEAVTESITPITILAAIYDGEQIISSEETVSFNSTTDSLSDKVKSVRLSLLGSDFDRRQDYFLVLRDKDNGIEQHRYRVVIDLPFTDDFF